MKFFICIFLLFISSVTTPNYLTYYKTINQANYAQFKREYTKADSLYQVAFSSVPRAFLADYKRAAYNGLHLSDDKKVVQYLNSAIDLGLTLEKIEGDNIFDTFRFKPIFEILRATYQERHQTFINGLDTGLRAKVNLIYRQDQTTRSDATKTHSDRFTGYDSENLEALKKIFKVGYPGYSKVGEDIELDVVFHHFSPINNETFFYDSLKQAVFNGELKPFRYAGIVDYDYIKKYNYTYYGTYTAQQYGFRILYPVEDFEVLNERRASIGLEPIEQYLETKDIIYDPYYQGL